MIRSRHLPWALTALTPLLLVAAVPLFIAADGPVTEGAPGPWVYVLIATAITVPAVTGLVILRRRPGNRIGWIMLLGPLPIAGAVLLDAGAAYSVNVDGVESTRAAVLGLLGVAVWPTLYLWPMTLALVFPTGTLPSPRWRPVAWAAFGAPLLMMPIMVLAADEVQVGSVTLPGPIDVLPGAVRTGALVVFWAAWAVMLAGLFAAVGAVVVRYRRSRGVERLQVTWLIWGAALIPLGLVMCGIANLVVTTSGLLDAMVPAVVLVGWVALSAAVGVAITRHGLYEIDRLVNRTLVYAALTVVLAAGFAVSTLAVGVVAGRGSAWATAAATLAVAAAFRPLRDRVQRLVDRRFARDRYDGLRRIRAFEDALRAGSVEPEGVEAALAEALGDPGVSVLLRLPESGTHVDVHGQVRPAVVDPSSAVTPVHRHGEQLGLLMHDPRLLERPDTLRSVVTAAALPIEIARLRAEVRVQLAEVEESRERIVRAGDEERRRLERDLHDGAQQRLVGLGVALRRIQRSLPGEARVLGPALDDAVGEVGHAIADLRTIAAGLRPPRLDDGLAAALGDLARAAPLPVAVDVDAPDLAPPVEVAAYYTVCEALTNAVKHARASRVDVSAVRSDGALLVRVRDDGVGGAVPGVGSGLTGIADRVGAHGGRLRVDSGPGSGTLVEVEIPCAS